MFRLLLTFDAPFVALVWQALSESLISLCVTDVLYLVDVVTRDHVQWIKEFVTFCGR